MQRTFDELIAALLKDDTWELPVEEREMYLWGFEWSLLYL